MKTEYRTRLHWVLEIGAWLMVPICLLIAVYGIYALPERIATHFSLHGIPDGYGSSKTLLLIPILMVPCLGIISLVAHVVNPSYWNIPFVVKEERKACVYADILTMLHAVELEFAVFMLYMQMILYHQRGTGIVLASAILTIALAATILGLCLRAYRHNR